MNAVDVMAQRISDALVARHAAMKADEEHYWNHVCHPGRIVRGHGRVAPKEPKLLVLEARGEPCEYEDCEDVACYGPCCFPPRGYSELNRLLCHDHLRDFRPETACGTCERLRGSLDKHRATHR